MIEPLARAPSAPVAPAYRWRLWNFRGWYEVGYLPMRNVSFDWKLNGIGSLQGSLGVQEGLPPIRPGEQVIIVERNGLPIWAGPIWPFDYDSSSAYVQLRASEWGSFLRRRYVRDYPWHEYWDPGEPGQDHQQGRPAGLLFRGIDQFDIARHLINATQRGYWELGGLAGDLRIRWGMPLAGDWGWTHRNLSGVNRDRNYAAVDRKEIWEAISQLSEVIDGFDFRFKPVYINNDPQQFHILFECFYPRQGPSQDQHGMVFEYKRGWSGSNVTKYTWSWKADSMINVADAANEETVVSAQDPAAWDFFPLLEGIAQKGGEGGVTSVDTLQQHADALLEENRRPRAEATLDLIPGLPDVGPDLIGGEARVRLTSWRHPPQPDGGPGFDDLMRIESIGVNAPSDERAESFTLTMQSMFWEAPRGGRSEP